MAALLIGPEASAFRPPLSTPQLGLGMAVGNLKAVSGDFGFGLVNGQIEVTRRPERAAGAGCRSGQAAFARLAFSFQTPYDMQADQASIPSGGKRIFSDPA
jgi:hypothetical protein